MIKRTRVEISKCIIHKVGNKYNSGSNALSNTIVKFDEESYDLLLPFLLKPFAAETQSYRFSHNADIRLNSMAKYSKSILEDDYTFVEESKKIVDHLYNQSNSAQIKSGDVLVVKFENLEYKDILVDAIGVFKIENKVDFFQTYKEDESFDVVVQKGISTKKLDKGCLILGTKDAEGTVILSVDNNQYDAQYWIKDFLSVKFSDDRNLHTQQYLHMCKEFADEVLKPQFGNLEQSNFLAEAVDYFKENESISLQDFKDSVFSEESYKNMFDEYRKNFETLNDTVIRNNFEVADEVFKKEKKKFKSEIKLDTNIQIKIDVDAPDTVGEYIEQGYDEEKKMKFYKVYYNAEK